MKKYVLGFDGGTGGVRAGIYDKQGNEISFASTEYPTYHPHSGWAEQDPADWWSCLAQSVGKAIKAAGVTKEEIVAVSYETTCCSVMLCMNDGTPLRNSLIWMDVRSSQEAAFLASTGNPALKFNGYGNVSAEWMPCKALWLKRNEPESYARAEKLCEYADWITFKLAGQWTANLCNMSTRWYYDARNGGFPIDFYEQIGLGDALGKFPQKIHHIGDVLGKITKEAAAHLGLSEDTIVGQGGVDAYVGILGLGVTAPGKIGLITGSSHLILGLTDVFNYRKGGVFGPYPDSVIKGLGLVEGGQTSSGSILSWYIKHFCKDLDTLPGGAYAVLNREATKIPPGADGLLVLDWWQGNRTPYTEPDLRGIIYGLSLSHTQAHLFRAIMEGVAFGTENVFASFRQAGYPVDEIYMGGGTTNSDLFMQIHADVSNVTIHVPENPQAPTLGSAILAAKAAGFYDTVDQATTAMVRYAKTIRPNPENHEKYKAIFAQYQKAYPEFGRWMKETRLAYGK
ncbi:MAG: FGGY family carbohydrate kinase [Oscillospiraceae bacterium]|nr:FGGY family carbohydrate kinase [Oscillospiraceae bacterium]